MPRFIKLLIFVLALPTVALAEVTADTTKWNDTIRDIYIEDRKSVV